MDLNSTCHKTICYLVKAELERQDKEKTLSRNEWVKRLDVKPIPSLFIITFPTTYSC